jgi:hypothetical protein
MASNTRWISYNDVNEHPEDSILLAYLRGQELEVRSNVIQHIDGEKCSVCLQKLNELKRVSATLDVLGDMRSYQYYPEVSVADTYARMQSAVNRQPPSKSTMNGAFNRHRPRKSAVRLISVPAAFGLAILFTMAMLVFANLTGSSFNPFSLTGGTSSGQNILTVEVPSHSISSPGANLTATVTATANGTPDGARNVKEPYIKVCSTQSDIDQLRLIICGDNFDSTHKATLIAYVPGKNLLWLRNIPVDKHGTLQVGWIIADCGNVPTFIYGYEVTSLKPIIVKLQITSFGICPAPTTTSVAKLSGLSPKLGP